MNFSKFVLAGGSGYLGSVLCNYYKDKAEEIVILSRSSHSSKDNIRYVVWDGKHTGPWVYELEGTDLLINLSGKNVNCRYNKKNRGEILSSRTEPTAALGAAIAMLSKPPKVWLNLASATIYRHAEDRPQDEDAGECGTGFSVMVCKDWEASFRQCSTPFTRKIVMRTGIVLGNRDGVWPRLVNLVKAGLGGPQGNGRQYISWIHELDFVRITEWLYHNAGDEAIYNVTAPQAVPNHQFMKMIRKKLGVPVGLSAPAWLLSIGAAIIGTETELLLKSRWVFPKRLTDEGFSFAYSGAWDAIGALADEKNRKL